MRPGAVAFVAGDGVLAAEGDWPGTRPAPGRGDDGAAARKVGGDLDLSDVPGEAAASRAGTRLRRGVDGGAGPDRDPGPLGPRSAGCDGPRRLFGLARLDLRSRACLVLDETEESHPEAKMGSCCAATAGRRRTG